MKMKVKWDAWTLKKSTWKLKFQEKGNLRSLELGFLDMSWAWRIEVPKAKSMGLMRGWV